MPAPEQGAMDVGTRAFLSATLPKLPEAVSQAMLADASVRAELGLPTGDYVRLFELRFDRGALFRCLRDVANGQPAPLMSDDGTLAIDGAELDAEGSALLVACDTGARFAHAGMLSDDRERRLATFDAVLARGEVSVAQEAEWRAALEAGPLDDAAFLAFEEMIEAIPEAVYRRFAAEAGDGMTFEALVPDETGFFAGLLGLAPPSTLGGFEAHWSAAAAELDRVRLLRLLRLGAPLGVLRVGLTANLSHRLERDDRLELARWLAGAPDPFSVLAAFEIALGFCADADFHALVDMVLPRLIDREDARLAPGASLLCSSLLFTTAISARRPTLDGWPVYARRLAWFLHASHLVRTFGDGQVDPATLAHAVASMGPSARLAELCDAAEAPFNLASPLTPAHVHAILLTRVNLALAQLPDAERPDPWAVLVNDAMKAALEAPPAILLVSPAPFDPFEPDWPGLPMLPRDSVEATLEAIDVDDDHQRILSDLFKMALAIEVEPEQRDAITQRLPKLVKAREGRDLLVAAEVALQLAARWRNRALADTIVEILHARAADPGLADPGAAPRLVLLAAACVADPVEWARRVGEIAASFAYVLQSGAPTLNMRVALSLMQDFAPALRGPLSPAQAFCVLSADRLPAPTVEREGKNGDT